MTKWQHNALIYLLRKCIYFNRMPHIIRLDVNIDKEQSPVSSSDDYWLSEVQGVIRESYEFLLALLAPLNVLTNSTIIVSIATVRLPYQFLTAHFFLFLDVDFAIVRLFSDLWYSKESEFNRISNCVYFINHKRFENVA